MTRFAQAADRHDPRQRILRKAQCLTGQRQSALDWFVNDAIASLDRLTAEELVACGRGAEVLRFLSDIERVERRGWSGDGPARGRRAAVRQR